VNDEHVHLNFLTGGVLILTEKELKKLNRYQLLELLVMQTEQNQQLQQQVEELTAQLHSRQMRMEALGSIAEASLELNGVFAAAQKAADDYLEAARRQAEQIIAQATAQMNGDSDGT
jgi:cell division septum initiation protein DivIVA